MNKIINKNKIILIIATIAVAGFSVLYATAGIFKTNRQAVNDLTSGLVGYWTFDGGDISGDTVLDKSGFNNHGALQGTTKPARTIGKIGQGLYFTATTAIDNNITLGDVDALDNQDYLTISFWVNSSTQTGAGSWAPFISKRSGSDGIYIESQANNCGSGKIDIRVNNGSGTGYICSSFTVLTTDVGNWHHWTIVFDGTQSTNASKLKFYHDGVQDTLNFNGGATVPNKTSNNSHPLLIGSTYFGLDAKMDEVRVYNRALSATEVTELYNQGAKNLVKINTSQTGKLTDGLIHYYTFDGPDMNGNTVYDKVSSGAINGTLTNCNIYALKPTRTIGKIGQGIRIMGDLSSTGDECVTLSSAFSTGTTFSVSFWMNPDADQSGFLFGQGNQLAMHHGSNGRIRWRYSSVDHYNNTNYLINNQAWNHIVVSIDNGTGTFYINGVADGITTNVVSMNAARIGGAGGQSGFLGSMDEVRIYNRALSASEITELYNQGEKNLLKINMPQTDLIPSGLVGYWTFNGQDTNWATGFTNDRSGNGYNGQMINMSTSTSPAVGISEQALNFLASGASVLRTDSGAISLDLTGSMTFAAWIKLNNLTMAQSAFLIKGGNYRIQLDDNMNCAGATNDQYELYLRFPSDACSNLDVINQVNRWYHIAVTFNKDANPDYTQFYVDGVPAGGVARDATPAANDSEFVIGNWSAGGVGTEFPGAIDEVRIYNRVLSANEVKELYKAGAGVN